MRLPTIFLIAVCLTGFVCQTAVAAGEDGFARGNRLYAAGKFAEAVTAYEEKAKRGEDSANLFYNLGDAHFRAGNRGRAILNYQRALLLEPTHSEAASNLAFIGGTRLAGANTVGGTEVLPWLAASAFWLVMAALVVAAMRGRRPRLAIVGVCLGLAGAVAGFYLLGMDRRTPPRALVIADGGAPALYSPADNSKVITTLPAGTEVRMLSAQGAWVYAQLNNGTRAWISSGKVDRLVPSAHGSI